MTKKIFSFALLAGLLGLMAVGTIKANFSIEGSLVNNYSSTIHFNQRGNDFAGLFLPRGETTLGIPQTVTFSGVSKLCTKQILGYYVNPQRGNRVRPLDSASLTVLQGMDSSYSGLAMSGGLFFACSGESATNVYGQVQHTYHGSDYYLLAGVDYNFSSGTYTSSFSGSAEFKSIFSKYTFNNYLYDTWGGIGQAVSSVTLYGGNTALTGLVTTGTVVDLSGDIVVAGTGFDGYILFSGVDIVVTGNNWNGNIVPPSIAVGTGMAVIGETGLNASGAVLTTMQVGATGSSLLASGGNFLVSFLVSNGVSNQQLFIYRSEDGTTRTPNTPSASCTLDINKMCSFFTDHLSFFAVLDIADGFRTTIGSGAICVDVDGCICNSANINYNATCIVVVPPVVSYGGGGGGSMQLSIDDCKRSSAKTINLPGANDAGIDYSKSYYDRDCGNPANPFTPTSTDTVDLGSIENSPYSYDLNQAYLYGYANKLTMADTIQKAGMKNTMTRKDLAIMVSSYAMRQLGIEPNANKKGCDKFTDTKKFDGDTQLYIMRSCQLGLMGLDTNGKALTKFRPNELVTRAHFAAIFSRLLFGSKYDGGKPYYEKHIAGLAANAIIKSKQNPQMKERRGYVMLMMMRADTKNVGRAKYHASASENGAIALLSD